MSQHHATILLAEDDPDLRDALETLLHRAGYTVVGTGNGLRAVELANQHRPAAAIVDLLLPGQSGFRVTHELKARFGDNFPVIVMSGNSSLAHQDYATASGADLFLAKPFAFATVVEAVAALCPLPATAAPRRRVTPSVR